MQAAGYPANATSLSQGPAEHILVFRPADERGLKAEFGYDDRKGVGACDRGPSGLGQRGVGR